MSKWIGRRVQGAGDSRCVPNSARWIRNEAVRLSPPARRLKKDRAPTYVCIEAAA